MHACPQASSTFLGTAQAGCAFPASPETNLLLGVGCLLDLKLLHASWSRCGLFPGGGWQRAAA